MPISSPVLDRFCSLLCPRSRTRAPSATDSKMHDPPSSGLQPGPHTTPAESSRRSARGRRRPARRVSAQSAEQGGSRASDLEILHTRLSNAHLLAHHQFELHPAGGVSYKPHSTSPVRHGRQPSHSLLPHVQPDPDAQLKDPSRSIPVVLSRSEKERFRALQVPSALCCISRTDEELLPFSVCFKRLNEGAANAVFTVQPCRRADPGAGFLFVAVRDSGDTATAIPSHMVTDKVLRVSKGLPKSLKSEVVVDGFMADVRPLFVSPKGSTNTGQTLEEIDLDRHLMAHLPVVLFDEGMSALKTLVPAIRPLSTTAQFGILLPDMSTIKGQNITFEIKPKWLAQSPSAPPDALRCRTCALQFSRGKGIPDDYICPLRLSDEDQASEAGVAHIRRWAERSLSLQLQNDANAILPKELSLSTLTDRIVTYFTTGDGRTLLLHLKKLQTTLDSEGILGRYARPRDDFNFVYDLRLAMTLRDCSLFIVVPLHDGDISSRLADLDFKSAEKIDDWTDKEATLVEEGWYVKSPEAHNVCLLAPKTST